MVMEDSLPEEHILKKMENVMQDSDEEYENMAEEEKRHIIRTIMGEEERCQLKAWVSAAYPDLKEQQEYLGKKARLLPPEEVERLKQRLIPPEDLERLKQIEKEHRLKQLQQDA